MVVGHAPVRRCRRLARPRRAIVMVEVPTPAFRCARVVQQDAMPSPHVAIENFHAPGRTRIEAPGHVLALGQEMFAAHHAAGKRLGCAPPLQQFIQAPLVRRLVFQPFGAVVHHQRFQIGGDRLPIAGRVDADVTHAVPGLPQARGERAHRRENRQDFCA